MDIKVKSEKQMTIGELKPGDAFISNTSVSGCIYLMKTDERYHNQEGTSACVELARGTLVSFYDRDKVIPISLTVIETPEPEG